MLAAERQIREIETWGRHLSLRGKVGAEFAIFVEDVQLRPVGKKGRDQAGPDLRGRLPGFSNQVADLIQQFVMLGDVGRGIGIAELGHDLFFVSKMIAGECDEFVHGLPSAFESLFVAQAVVDAVDGFDDTLVLAIDGGVPDAVAIIVPDQMVSQHGCEGCAKKGIFYRLRPYCETFPFLRLGFLVACRSI